MSTLVWDFGRHLPKKCQCVSWQLQWVLAEMWPPGLWREGPCPSPLPGSWQMSYTSSMGAFCFLLTFLHPAAWGLLSPRHQKPLFSPLLSSFLLSFPPLLSSPFLCTYIPSLGAFAYQECLQIQGEKRNKAMEIKNQYIYLQDCVWQQINLSAILLSVNVEWLTRMYTSHSSLNVRMPLCSFLTTGQFHSWIVGLYDMVWRTLNWRCKVHLLTLVILINLRRKCSAVLTFIYLFYVQQANKHPFLCPEMDLQISIPSVCTHKDWLCVMCSHVIEICECMNNDLLWHYALSGCSLWPVQYTRNCTTACVTWLKGHGHCPCGNGWRKSQDSLM